MWTYNTELYHHGIKGQRWGVRRYQNYDGSYTKKGLARYNKSLENYERAQEDLLAGRGSKLKVKEAKKQLKEDKKNLELDYRADKGKELYRSGKTISGNRIRTGITLAASEVGVIAINSALKKIGPEKNWDPEIVDAGMRAVQKLGLAVDLAAISKSWHENRNLRAYYSHKS